MKGNKIIATSIASMMLVAGMAMPKNLAAASTEIRYAKNSGYLTSDSSAIVVGLTNGDKDLTRDELSQLVKDKYGLTVAEVTGTVGTGAKIKLSTGETATLVLYGDTEADGKIDYNDVQKAFDITRGTKSVAERSAEYRAADIEAETSGSAVIDYNDVQRLFDHVRDVRTDLVVHTSKLPNESATFDSNVTLNITSGKYINNENLDEISVQVKLGTPVEGDYYLTIKDKNGDPVNISGFTDGTHNKVTFTEETISQTLSGIDFTGKDDGVYTLVLSTDAAGKKVVATTTIEKVSTPLPEVVKIKTKRTGANTGDLSFLPFGESDITEIYYKVVGIGESVTRDTLVDIPNHQDNGISIMSIVNNKLDFTQISDSLIPTDAAKVYFVAVNKYGNASRKGNEDGVYEAIITKGVETTLPVESKPTSVTLTASANTGSEVTLTANYSATASRTYIVTLYDEAGNIIKEETATTLTQAFKVKEAGKYKVGVVVKGNDNGETKDSDEVISDVFEVEKLTAPTGITFTENTDDRTDKSGTLTWTGVPVNERSSKLAGYSIKVEQYSESDEKFIDVTSTFSALNGTTLPAAPDAQNQEKYDFNTLKPNTVYKVTVVSKVKTTSLNVLDSDETESSKFVILHASNLLNKVSSDSNSVTLTVDKSAFNFETQPTYDINIWIESSREGSDETKRELTTKTVPVVKTEGDLDYLVIDGLTENGVTYYFTLILKYDGKSDKAVDAPFLKTKLLLPAMNNLTVANSLIEGNHVNNGEVFVDSSSNLYIGNLKITSTTKNDYEDPDHLIDTLIETVKALKPTDVVKSVATDKVTVELHSEGTEVDVPRDFATANLKNKTLEITGNTFQQGIKANVENANVVLKGSGCTFDISAVTVKNGKIIVEDGVNIITIGNTAKAIPAVEVQNTAKLDGVLVTGKATYYVKTNHSIMVAASESNLTFTKAEKGALSIGIDLSSDRSESVQSGNVTIIANGDVKLATTGSATVSGNVDITTTNGGVDLTSSLTSITGSKKITVTCNDGVQHVISATTNKVIPTAVNSLTGIASTGVALKDSYTDTELAGLTSIEDKETARAFLTSFGIDESADAKLVINGNKVTITFGVDSEANGVVINL